MNFLKLYQKLDDTVSYLLSSVCNEKKLLKEHIKKEKIVLVDIGTNVGSYVDFVSKSFEIKTLYCFEPQERLAQDLEKISYVEKKYILPFALSNVEKIKKFYEYNVSSQSGFYKINNGYSSLQQIKKIKKIKTKVFDKVFDKNLKSGSIIYDLAAIQGGNSAFTEVDKIVVKEGVKIMGEANILNKLPVSASNLYSKNVLNFVTNLYDKEKKKVNINLEDEIIKKTLIK